MAKGKKHKQQTTEVTPAQAVRDVLIHAIDNGQGLSFLFGCFCLLLLWKMPEDGVYELTGRFLDGIMEWGLVGWVLFGISIILWVRHAMAQRKNFKIELDRIGKEKSALQKHLIGKPLKSSNE